MGRIGESPIPNPNAIFLDTKPCSVKFKMIRALLSSKTGIHLLGRLTHKCCCCLLPLVNGLLLLLLLLQPPHHFDFASSVLFAMFVVLFFVLLWSTLFFSQQSPRQLVSVGTLRGPVAAADGHL